MKKIILFQITTNHIKQFLNNLYISFVSLLGILVALLYWEIYSNQLISVRLFLIGNLWLIIVLFREDHIRKDV